MSSPNQFAGESLAVPERMIVSPAAGVFRPAEHLDGESSVEVGTEVGVVEGPGTVVSVRSPFGGQVIGVLAFAGERLRAGQPVAWLRVA
jgi:[acyl-carrier-protein] S-malonyltransferase